MSDRDTENGEEAIDQSGRNLTQQEIDERGPADEPADANWQESPAERDDTAISGRPDAA